MSRSIYGNLDSVFLILADKSLKVPNYLNPKNSAILRLREMKKQANNCHYRLFLS